MQCVNNTNSSKSTKVSLETTSGVTVVKRRQNDFLRNGSAKMARVFRNLVSRHGKRKEYRIHTHLQHEHMRYSVSFKVEATDEESAIALASKEFSHSFGKELPDDFKILEVMI